jgi:Tfp pilus assembly protein PilV
MGLVEVMIALFLATVSVAAIFSLQAPAFKTTAKADYLGRAAEIVERQLESTEVYVMDPSCVVADANLHIPAIPAVGASTNAAYDVNTSGFVASITGDATYHVSTTITGVAGVTTNYFRVDVRVTWNLSAPVISAISQTIFVSRQAFFDTGICS